MAPLWNISPEVSGGFSSKKRFLYYFLLIFIATFLLLTTIFFAYSSITQKHELQTKLVNEAVELKSSSKIITLLLEQKLADLLVLAEGEILREYLYDNSMANKVQLAREFLLLARRKPKYAQIRMLDTEGNEIIRINNSFGSPEVIPTSELQNKSHRYYFQQTMDLPQGDVYISPMDLNVEYGEIVQPLEPTIRFATPVFDGYGVKRGIVIINYSPDELLERVASLADTLVGDSVILNSDGYWLTGVPEEKLWGFMFNRKESFASNYPSVWSAMNQADHGTLDTDEGVFIFQKCRLILRENLGTLENLALVDNPAKLHNHDPYWILVSLISKAKIDELHAEHAIISSVTYLTLLLVASLFGFLIARMAVEKQLAYRQLQERAVTDELTGAVNRRELNKISQGEFVRAQRFKRPLSIMMLDLDRFKVINDTFGHSAGDQVLKHVTTICQSTIREQDLLARFGGEEFVILMPETGIEGAQQLANRLCANIRVLPYKHLHNEILITVSIGISTLNEDDADYGQILVRADNALYEAKTAGRDRVEVILKDTDLEP
jgi:diguanylate cyclase (GGDEF)-like protein